MEYKKGNPPPPHKSGCNCFRCTKTPWNKGKKGSIPWNKGVAMSGEQKKKISLSKKGTLPWITGRKHTSQSIEKMKRSHAEYRPSEETKKKISKAMMGKNTWMKGRKMPTQTREALLRSNTGENHYLYGKTLPDSRKKKLRDLNTGKKYSEESKSKKSKSLRKAYAEGRHRSTLTLEACRKGGIESCRVLSQKKTTSIEKAVYDYLLLKGILFEKQKEINGKFVVDAYIPSLNLIVEADGVYWHSLPKSIKKDKAENAYLKKCGYNLLRLGEDEINKGDFINRLEVYLS